MFFYRIPLQDLNLPVSGMFFQSCPNYKCSPLKCKIFHQSQDCWNVETFICHFFLVWRGSSVLIPSLSQTRMKFVTIINSALWGLILTVCVTLHISIDIFARWRHVRPPRANINQLEQPGRFTSWIFTACSASSRVDLRLCPMHSCACIMSSCHGSAHVPDVPP